MGVINSLPINTSTIPELTAYGSVDDDAKKKDLIEITKNSGTSVSPVYDTGASRKIPLDELQALIGQKPRFFEKLDTYTLVYSSLVGSDLYNGQYQPFSITPDMQGYYLQMHLLYADSNGNAGLLWGNNLAWIFNFIGTFPDGFCIRIQTLTLGASKCNVSEFYLTSGKAYDFIYNSELNHWAIDELENICHPSSTYLPMYAGEGPILQLTNSNHTYIFKYGNFASPTKSYTLLPTSIWRGRKITIYIDKDIPDDVNFGPFFYPTHYALATGTNDYTASYTPSLGSYKKGQIIWIKVPSDSTGAVTINAGIGSKKAYVSGVQVNSGDLFAESLAHSGIYEFSYDPDLDSTNGGWNYEKEIGQPDLIEGFNQWRFPYGVSGIKKGSYVVFESEGFGSIKIADMNIII